MKFISAIVYKCPVWSLLVPLCTSVQYEVWTVNRYNEVALRILVVHEQANSY